MCDIIAKNSELQLCCSSVATVACPVAVRSLREYIYVCMYVCMYIHMYKLSVRALSLLFSLSLYIYIYYLCVCVCVCLRVCVCVCMCL